MSTSLQDYILWKQVDSSLSKNQVLLKLTYYYNYNYNDIKRKSHDHGLITKKCVAMQKTYF